MSFSSLTAAIVAALVFCAPFSATASESAAVPHAVPAHPGGEAEPADAAEAAPMAELDTIEVVGSRYLPVYLQRTTRSATRTDTPLLDVPQSITVVTRELIRDQALTGLVEVLRYVPGVGVAQGEGNRDTAVLRGNSSTADFFIDGVRDDVQYIRDLYTIERVEALKGPNAMIFGRGGSGGVINRVSKIADGETRREVALQFGTDARRRIAADVGGGIGGGAGWRLNAMHENSDSFRDGFHLKRTGVSPTVRIDLGASTTLDLGYEYFRDQRVADRGVGSYLGRPIDTDPSLFIGNPEQSPVRARVHALDASFVHAFSGDLELRNRTRYADYDKFYQNVFGNGVSRAADGSFRIALGAYNNASQRTNLFNQTDLVWRTQTGSIGHELLAGIELGRQVSDNRGMTGTFAGSNVVPLSNPRYAGTVVFAPTPTSADNHVVATLRSLYAQDQITLSPNWLAVVGLRHDRFDVDLANRRDGKTLSNRDGLWSPRAGLIWKPADALSLYASYSLSHLPRSGEQMASLTVSNRSLDPERFVNREVGFKWDVRPNLAFTVATYVLDRRNVAVPDPIDPTRSLLIDGQRVKGIELGLAGQITERWQMMGGYSHQSGRILRTLSPTARAGNRLAQLPSAMFSLWNRYDVTPKLGFGLGLVHRNAFFASTDNTVKIPGFTRVDAAVFYRVNEAFDLQLNVENLGNARYFASAHNNQNISPGSPRAAMLSLHTAF